MKRLKHASMMAVLILCLMGTFFQVGWAGEGAPEKINCDAEIAWDVVKEAKLTQFDCALGESGGQPALIFTVGLENASDKPQRYRVNLFMDNGKAVGGLIPRTTKEGLVEPGQSKSFDYPVIDMPLSPKTMTLIIKTASQ